MIAPMLDPGVLVFSRKTTLEFVRRAVDVAVVALLSPIALAIVALAAAAIYLEDRGPIFFDQRRVGRYGRPFTIFKLRTMRVADCGDRLKPRDGSDPRITRVGFWLRRLSIDEVPQFFNVLRGEMTLIGPRPEMPFVVAGYERWQHLRHLVKPGITCLWQVTCRSTIPLERPEATQLDLRYIRERSLALDLCLLYATAKSLIVGRNAV